MRSAVHCSGVLSLGFEVQGLEFMVSGTWYMLQGS